MYKFITKKQIIVIRYILLTFMSLGLLTGLIYSVGGAFYDYFNTGINEGTLLAFAALVGMPLIGLVLGLILCAIYLVVSFLINKLGSR